VNVLNRKLWTNPFGTEFPALGRARRAALRSARREDLEWADGNVGGSNGAVSVKGRGSHSGLMLPPWQPKAINSGGQ